MKTWRDLRHAALHDPICQAVLWRCEHGESPESVLLEGIVMLAEASAALRTIAADALSWSVKPVTLTPPAPHPMDPETQP